MMEYASYDFYAGTYMGNVRAEDYPRLSARASVFLDYYTQNRAKDNADLDAVKLCFCALVDKYAVIEAAQDMAMRKIIAANTVDAETKSETVGGHSRTLAIGAESAAAALNVSENANGSLAETCRAYLAHTGLLYRGRSAKCTLPTL